MKLDDFYKDDYMVTQLTSIYNIQWSRRQNSLQPTGHGCGSVKLVTMPQRNTSVATKELEDKTVQHVQANHYPGLKTPTWHLHHHQVLNLELPRINGLDMILLVNRCNL